MSLSKAKMDITKIKNKFQDLCRELNMDKETEESAWTNHNDISQKFSLDGDPCQWLCCALYAACRESYRPTVGGSNEVVKGNCVSLTKLLRSCNVSLYDFITKMKNWCEMANLQKSFIDQVERLEQGFIITLNLFECYNKIFDNIFVIPSHEKKNKKSRPVKCSANKLYDLCWCLFLCAKNQDLNCSVDLMYSLHLLLCCIDLVYVNALAENRTDLINPNFEGVPNEWNTPEFNATMVHNHCIIEPLCKFSQGINEEAKSMKKNSWKKIMTEFIETKTLHGNKDTFLEIISNNNFERNLKSLNSAYEQYVLSVGEFDETILLYNTNFRKSSSGESSSGNTAYINQGVRSLGPKTPLTRRHHLPTKDNISEPVAMATQNVRKLQDVDLTESLDYIRQAGDVTMEKIKCKLDSMEAVFKEKFPITLEAEKRFALARSLYFDLLEKIVRAEVATKPNVDLKVLLETDTLNSALITCCVELVLNAYNSQLKFPWVLKCFGFKPFNFIKIIEIVVKRQQDILTRALIKHLNFIEETCLESLAWASDSPVWSILQQRNTPLPPWADVDVNKMAHCSQERNLMQSPMNSAYDCFNSASSASASTSESARRDLFNAGRAAESRPVDVSKPSTVDSRRDVSLSIFLRKFYTLAWMRMNLLCKELEMGDEIHMTKIWTLFEYSIIHRTELMQDRHLDQLLMCAIYIYIKVGEIPRKSFTDIMSLYRKQPQSASNIYREVLINSAENSAPVYGDIILFYNTIYVQKMTPHALNFSGKKKSQHDLLLSPHPTEKVNPPKRLSNQLYVHQLEKNEVQYSPNHVTYEFHKSPAKDLDKMNEIVRRGKRNLTFDDDEAVVNKDLTRSSLHFQAKILCIKND